MSSLWGYACEFENDGEEDCIRINGQLAFNTSDTMVDAALQGYGVACVPGYGCAHVVNGRLLLMLSNRSPRFTGYFPYYLTRGQNLPAFSVVVETLAQQRSKGLVLARCPLSAYWGLDHNGKAEMFSASSVVKGLNLQISVRSGPRNQITKKPDAEMRRAFAYGREGD